MRNARRVPLFLLLFVSGCQNMTPTERTWQTLHAIDVAQTLNATSDGCYREVNSVTRRLIGSQPSEERVLAWGLAMGFLHAGVSRTLEERGAPRWLRMTWDVLTISSTGSAVLSNHREGARPWGSNEPVPGCSG